jgi:hypothetical protein
MYRITMEKTYTSGTQSNVIVSPYLSNNGPEDVTRSDEGHHQGRHRNFHCKHEAYTVTLLHSGWRLHGSHDDSWNDDVLKAL